jgi:ubiquinone/menaquinone biosynthesis C-methylase UbiE
MYDALQHIQNREQALHECLWVLAPNGVLCVIEWNKKTIEFENEKYGYEIDYLDPREYLEHDDISVDTYYGEFTNFYILRKN